VAGPTTPRWPLDYDVDDDDCDGGDDGDDRQMSPFRKEAAPSLEIQAVVVCRSEACSVQSVLRKCARHGTRIIQDLRPTALRGPQNTGRLLALVNTSSCIVLSQLASRQQLQ
jgi:hypothetical protein